MQCAPICLFTYNRARHAQQTLIALQKNELAKESDLYIFSDGPKNQENEVQVQEVRNLLEHIEGFKTVTVIHQEKNRGLANSIIEGVSQIVNQFGKVIVMEDDLVVSPYFLKYMNEALEMYAQDDCVASIHGYAYPIKEEMPTTYFMKGADCWGWATWERAWKFFEKDGTKLLAMLQSKGLAYEFDFHGTQPNIEMLKNQIVGKNNSWAIRWHASAFLQNMLTLYPGKSLVRNIGFDNSGEHCAVTSIFDVTPNDKPVALFRIPLEESKKAFKSYVKFFKNAREPIYRRILRKAKALLSA
ncbi:MAG: glycosyl transferase [Gammaproteobacteria bacterium 39-13]|nr:glycosyltransferase family 2 protein [Gammaproteobacteria bacterium]OJV87857.1 MAG: glycosyl transferase [Gammaproteobacteria bacterium 39-13]